MRTLYEAQAASTGDGRNGHVRSSDGVLDFDLAMPVSLGGNGGATNPEQLFAAGYAACFHSALITVARRLELDPAGSTVTANVGLNMNDQRGYELSVRLFVAIPDLGEAVKRELVEAAHQVCPYSNATRGNIDVQLVVE